MYIYKDKYIYKYIYSIYINIYTVYIYIRFERRPFVGISSAGREKPRVFLYELIQKHHVTK